MDKQQLDVTMYELYDLSATDVVDIESDHFEIVGEDENGNEGSWECSITELAGKAHSVIKSLRDDNLHQAKRITELEKKVSESRLEEAFQWKGMYQAACNNYDAILKGIPEIQAKAIENLITEFNANYYGEDLCQWLEQQANNIRQQAQEKSNEISCTVTGLGDPGKR